MVRLIREFANTRAEEIQKLKNIRDVMKEHLMCIYYWRDCSYKQHWEGEIVGFMPIMSKLKGIHKLLPEKLIYENLFTDWADRLHYDIYAYIDKIMLKEPNLPPIQNEDEHNLYKFLEEFYKKVCHLLATDGSIRKDVIYELIEELLIKYPYDIYKEQ